MKKYIYLMVALLLCIQAFAQGHFPGTVLPATPNTAPWNVYSAAPDQRQNASVTNAQSLALVPTAASGTDIFAYYTVDTTGYLFYLVYTTNGSIPTKTNGTVVSMSFAANSAPNRIWAGKIPQQAAGTVVNYVIYVNTTGGTLAASNNRIATSRLGIQSTWTEGDAYYSMMTPGGVTNAVAWYKADTGLTGTTWADQSGYTYNLTRTSAPAGANTLNFNPVASFTGVTANHFNNTAAKAAWPVGNTATTYYYVARNTAAIANRAALGIGANGAATGFHSGEVASTGLISSAGSTNFNTGAATASLASPPDWDNSKSNQGINLVRTGYDGAGASGRNYVAAQGSAATTNTNNVNPTYPNTSAFRIGAPGDNGIFWNGDVAEVIVYPSQHGSTDYLKVETYLALKYGITKSGIYQLSDGTAAYNDAVYNNNIAGIGRDNATGLHQKQSQSQNIGLQPVIGNVNITDTNANNTNSFTADLSALVWGSDTGSSSFATSFAFGTMNNRMDRIWKIEETGTVGTVMVAIPASFIASNVSGLNLLVSSSATFNGASVMLPMALQTLGGTQYYTASVDFTSGQFFTFGAYVTGPGGILPAAWYKASEGVYSDSGITLAASGQDVQQWNSVTGSFNFSQLTAADKPNYTPGVMINFNPTITFDRSNTEFMQYTPGAEVIDRASGTLYGLGNSSQISIPAGIFGFDDTMDFPGMHLLITNKLLLYALNFIPETTGTISLNQPYVYGGSWQMGAGSTASNMLMDLRLNGDSNSYNTVPNAGINLSPLFADLRIGGDNNYGSFDGQLPEAVVFENYLNASERDKVDAYFAIKYGITLSHNYYASNWNGTSGTTLWNIAANAGYNNNIAGIARDDASALNQKQSQSVNSGLQPVIGNLNITNTNANNTNNFSSDLSALVWGSDTGSTSFGTSFIFGGLNNRMSRIWKVQETGTVGVVKVALPASQIPTNIQSLSLMVSPDAVFDGSDTRTAMILETLGGISYYTATVDFTSGQFFTFAGLVTAPGGVLGASIWLRADSGTSTSINGTSVSQWNDKSANSNNVSQATAANQPLYKDNAADNINFNPVIDFDGSNDILNDSNGIIGTATYNNAAAFVVNVTKAISNSYVFLENLGTGSAITMHTPWSDNTAYWDGANSSRISAAWGGSVNTPYLWTGWNNNSLTPKTSFRRNGLQISSGNTLASYTGNNSNFSIGSTYNGRIGEIAFYPIALTAVERQRVESYLAVKYGFTLDQTAAQNYLNSSSGVIWNATANTGYNNNIAGIGRDDFSTLNQKQSQSVNSGLQPVIGNVNITDTNANNSNNFSTDLSALVWGSDTGSTSFATSFLFGGSTVRMARIWKVQETGTVGVVKVALRVADIPANVASPALVVSSDAVFDGTDSRTAMTLETLGGVQYYTATVDFTSGQFFTFAAFVTAPGGVVTGLDVWLRGDIGLTGSTTWLDQSGNGRNLRFDISDCVSAAAGSLGLTRTLNFNKVADFVPNTWGMIQSDIRRTTAPNADVAVVYDADAASVYDIWGTDLGGSIDERSLTTTQIANDNTAISYSGGNTGDPTINLSSFNGTVANGSNVVVNGNSVLNFTGSTTYVGCNTIRLGDISPGNSSLDGTMGEFVVYNRNLSALERIRLNSYLAIKYGTTLGRNNNGNGTSGEVISGSILEGDYVASDGITRIWNSDTTYQNNIAGIARDDFSALNQKQSRSVNSGLQPVIGNVNIADTNANNTNNFSSDLSALVWGSDTGSASFATSFIFGGLNNRMTRIWKVQETGTVGVVKVALRVADLPANVTSPALVVSADAVFDGTDARTAMTLETLGGVQYYTATVDFTSGQFFTFAALLTAPGGVISGLKIWHRADAGVTASGGLVTSWSNTITNNNAVPANIQPQYVNSGTTLGIFNFNPYVNFSNTNNSLLNTADNPFTQGGSGTFFFTTNNLSGIQMFGVNASGASGTANYDNPIFGLNAMYTPPTSLAYSLSMSGLSTGIQRFTFTPSYVTGQLNMNGTGFLNATPASVLGGGGYILGSDSQSLGGDDAGFTGSISETVAYDTALSATDIQKVNSYLAIKYGVTLDQATTYTNFNNGNFNTGNFNYWTSSGNVTVSSNIAAFNGSNTTPNGVISQSINTVNGQSYTFAGDLIRIGPGAGTVQLKLDVIDNVTSAVIGTQTLTAVSGTAAFSQLFTGNGNDFTIRFTDISAATVNVDIGLDNLTLSPNTSVTGTNYLNSVAAIIWNATANSTYSNNIAGIARDDFSALNQKQSQSVNSGSQVVMALGTVAASNQANANVISADKQSFIWGDDNGSISNLVPTGNGTYSYRFIRIWKTQNTGSFAQNITVYYPVSAFGNAPATTVALLYSASAASLSNGTASAIAQSGTTTINGVSYYTFTLPAAQVANMQFFSFTGTQTAPGGVLGASLWLKSDAGVTPASGNVTSWSDQTLTNTFTITNTLQTGVRTINFNNAVYFNSSGYMTGNTAISFKNGYGAYAFDSGNGGIIMSGTIPNNTNTNYFFSGQNMGAGDNSADGTLTYVSTTTSIGFSPVVVNMDIISGLPPSSTLAYLNGGKLVTQLLAGSGNMSNHSSIPYIGRSNDNSNQILFAGRLGELVMYPVSHTAIERQRINTYLAIKYGATLSRDTDSDSTPGEVISGSVLEGDYVASDGTTRVWNGDATYQNNIAGIARDDFSALNQKQSQSVNSGLQPVIGNGNIFDTNANNTNNFSTDLSALVWGSDTGSTSFATSFAFGGSTVRMARIWKVQETGTVGVVKVALRVADLPANVSSPALVVSSDAVFDGTDNRTAMVLETLGGVQYYTATVDFTSGQFFTFAAFVTAPGGVISGLKIWHKADAGVTAASNLVTAWTNQVDGRQVINAGGSERPTFANGTGSLFNFNPYLSFTANTNTLYDAGATPFITDGDITFFSALRPATIAGNEGQIFGINNPSASLGNAYDSFEWFQSGFYSESSNVYTSYSSSLIGLDQSILTFTHSGALNISNGYRNLNVIVNNITTTGQIGSGGYAFGSDAFASGNNVAPIAQFSEHIAYNRVLSAIEIQRVQTYLALKTGVTLNQNYIASDGTTAWWNATANSTYSNNIAGIARDDFSALNQKQSQSVNSGLQPVIGNGNITDTNANNTNNFSTDVSALVWGSDTGSTSFATSFVFGGSTVRMARIWKVQETGTVGVVKVALRAADIPANVSSPALVVSSDAVFDGTDTRTAMVLETLGGVQYYTATVDFSSGQFFTFAALATAPGGVLGSTSWFKSDADVTLNGSTVSAWKNQSLNANLTQLSQATASRQPTYSNIGWNFNPSITYDGSSDILENTMPSLLNVLNATNNEVFGALSITGGTGARVYLQLSDNGGSSPRLTLENTATQFPTNVSSIANTGLSQTSNLPSIINFSSGSGNLSYVINGGSAATGSFSGSLTAGSIPRYMIGAYNQGGTYANFTAGNINEIITYDKTLTTTEKQQVQTYLAIKYGQVLAHNYLSSSAGIIWNVTTNAGYNNNIAGIARDDFSALNQKQSQSVNSGSQVVMALGTAAVSNQANTGTIPVDKQFFIWGDDNGSLSTFVSTGTISYPSRFTRVWKTQNTGTFAENMTVYYPVSAFGTSLASSVGLLYGSSAASLSNGSASVIPQSGTATINGVSYYVFTVPAAQVANMQFFSFTGNTICYKPAVTVGTTLDTKHGITALGRAGSADLDNWPMVRKGAWTVLEAKTKGFVINRLTAAQIAAIPAANLIEGMMIYDTTNNCMKVYTSTDGGTTFNWQCISTQTCPD